MMVNMGGALVITEEHEDPLEHLCLLLNEGLILVLCSLADVAEERKHRGVRSPGRKQVQSLEEEISDA